MNGHIEEEKLALLAGGEMDAGETAGLACHLTACPACCARLKAYQADRLGLEGLREVNLGEDDFHQVRRIVMQRLPARTVSRFRFALPQWGALAASLLIAGSTGLWFWSRVPAPQKLEMSPSENKAQLEPVQPQRVGRAGPVDKVIPGRPTNAKPIRASRKPRQAAAIIPPPPAIGIAADVAVNVPLVQDEVIIKLETPDPNIVIIWLASPKGAGR